MASFLKDVSCETHILLCDGLMFEGCLMRNAHFVMMASFLKDVSCEKHILLYDGLICGVVGGWEGLKGGSLSGKEKHFFP